MATETTELDTLAFELFKARAGRQGGEFEALAAYKQAEAFLSVRDKVHTGELTPAGPEGPQLADCCCPNMPRTHPYNLVAKLHTDRKGVETLGDLGKVNRIKKWLDKNPTPESDPENLVSRLNREFPELGWDLPTINTARAILPAYCN